MRAGKFLRYLITNRGIKANPNQIEVVNHLKPLSNPKEVQVLTGMLATLNRFISKFANRYRPFYQHLKKWKGFQWNEECDRAFQDLKDYLMQVPMLMTPESGEDLFMYLSMSDHAVSAGSVKRPRNTVTSVLHQQNPGRSRDKIPTLGEAGVSPSARYEEAAALFSSSYCICPNRVSFTG